MNKDDIDKLWHQAMNEAVKNGEDFTRYRFANLVAEAEREACEMAVEDIARKYQQAHEVSAENVADACAYVIRARGNT
jgi:hypothetical protein